MKELISKKFLKDMLFIFIILLLIFNIIEILYPDFRIRLLKNTVEDFKNKKNINKKIVHFWQDIISD